MVRFDARPGEQYDSERFLVRLEAAVQKCVELDAELEQLDEEITLNPAFVKRWVMAKRQFVNLASNKVVGTCYSYVPTLVLFFG